MTDPRLLCFDRDNTPIYGGTILRRQSDRVTVCAERLMMDLRGQSLRAVAPGTGDVYLIPCTQLDCGRWRVSVDSPVPTV